MTHNQIFYMDRVILFLIDKCMIERPRHVKLELEPHIRWPALKYLPLGKIKESKPISWFFPESGLENKMIIDNSVMKVL